MDIRILGDNKISRRNHCVIVYDAKQSQTVILPGDSNDRRRAGMGDLKEKWDGLTIWSWSRRFGS